MLKRSLALASGLCVSLATPLLLAQPAPAAPPPAAVTPSAALPAPGAAGPSAAAPAEPQLPVVSDDMLSPVPPAPHVLSSWREALELLRNNSTTLRSLRAQEEVSRAQVRQVSSALLPTLSADASVTRQLLKGEARYFDPAASAASGALVYTNATVPDPATTWQAGLNLRVPLLDLDAWQRRGTAKAAIDVATLNTKAAERLSIAAVADAVVATVTAERLAEVSRVSLESALSTLDLYKRRAALGAASAIDVMRIEQEVSLSRDQVVAANEGVLRARENLGATLGSAEAWGVTPQIRLDALANDAKSSCRPTQDVVERADVRAAEASVTVARRNEEGVSKTYWPTLDAVSNLTYWSPESGINNEHVTWSVGGVLSWTLYDGGLRYATRESLSAERRVAAERLSEAKRQARIEVAQAYRAVRFSEARLAVAARTRDVAAELSRLSKVAYLNGSGTSFDLVDSAKKQRDAELDYTIKEFDVLRAKIAALLALAVCDV